LPRRKWLRTHASGRTSQAAAGTCGTPRSAWLTANPLGVNTPGKAGVPQWHGASGASAAPPLANAQDQSRRPPLRDPRRHMVSGNRKRPMIFTDHGPFLVAGARTGHWHTSLASRSSGGRYRDRVWALRMHDIARETPPTVVFRSTENSSSLEKLANPLEFCAFPWRCLLTPSIVDLRIQI
jgi:hypothetical protein